MSPTIGAAEQLAEELADFLGVEIRQWPNTPSGSPLSIPAEGTPNGMLLQTKDGRYVTNGLEVLISHANSKPKTIEVRKTWSERWGKRAAPVLLVVTYPTTSGNKASICGSPGEKPPVTNNVDLSQVYGIVSAAMSEPDHNTAIRALHNLLPQLDPPFDWMKNSPIGLTNVGLMATHQLLSDNGVPGRSDWNEARKISAPLLKKRGRELVEALGFKIEPASKNVSRLTVGSNTIAVALFCNDDEPFEAPSNRLNSFSPVSRALAEAGRDPDNIINWVILTRGSEIRLYSARPNIGVGRKGRGDTFVELNLIPLPEDKAAYLYLLFSSEALSEEGSVDEILAESERFATDLAARLRKRVYHETVPALATAIVKRIQTRNRADQLSSGDLRAAYELVMFILFRLLFVAYGEATDLLPFKTNEAYKDASITSIVRTLLDSGENDDVRSPSSTKLWNGVLELWKAINSGNKELGVPVYNGGLFSNNVDYSQAGAQIAELDALTDAEFAPALLSMLVDDAPEGRVPIDFRSLSVREFGTIYEGLLESQLVIRDGDVSFVNHSGERKASGTYFTKPFVVEHLLDAALEPALDNHIKELVELHKAQDDAKLAGKLFDFKCADIAMGSGHFLVAALDRIEVRLSAFLTDYPIAEVVDELYRLRNKAHEAIDDAAGATDIEMSSLLRRQIARHCVYGVDKNQIAVELARLSIWIHTFIPGLPLSFLDHNFVCGDSLAGVGTIEDAEKAYIKKAKLVGEKSLFTDRLRDLLKRAEGALLELAKTSDADKKEVEQAHNAHLLAQEKVRPARSLFDIITAVHDPDCDITLPVNFEEETFNAIVNLPSVKNSISELAPIHFPAVFPEVFLRERPGFDVVLGNPPWEEVIVQEDSWWVVHFPELKLKGLDVGTKKWKISKLKCQHPHLNQKYEDDKQAAERYRGLLRIVFSGLGSGHTDLYKAFCWRKWSLIRNKGYEGVVLPGSALKSKGLKEWRNAVLKNGTFSSITTLINKNSWVFEDVGEKYDIALISLTKVQGENINFAGPFLDLGEFDGYQKHTVETVELRSWSDDLLIPSIPQQPGALKLFRKLRRHERLNGQTGQSTLETGQDRTGQDRTGQDRTGQDRQRPQPRPIQELNSTTDKHRFVLDRGESARTENSTQQTTSTDLFSTPETLQ